MLVMPALARLNRATNQQFREPSRVANLRLPQKWVREGPKGRQYSRGPLPFESPFCVVFGLDMRSAFTSVVNEETLGFGCA